MFRKIREISINTKSGGLYAIIDWWDNKASHDAGDQPTYSNSFHMDDAEPTQRAVVRDGRGFYKKLDGTFVDLDSIPESVRDELSPSYDPATKELFAKKNYEMYDAPIDWVARLNEYADGYEARRAANPGRYPVNDVDDRQEVVTRSSRSQDDTRGVLTASVRAAVGTSRGT